METAEPTDEWAERNVTANKYAAALCMNKNKGYLKVSGSLCYGG